ncbi:hypothetical protein N692_12175 [Lactiplantibacillus plantarum EGD-AQ4]|nr:hypothetical protein N692_12175 [Lactiplantibacillus plantarum EGD-AQ4]
MKEMGFVNNLESLNSYESLKGNEMKTVFGGSQADYNFSWGIGHTVNKALTFEKNCISDMG